MQYYILTNIMFKFNYLIENLFLSSTCKLEAHLALNEHNSKKYIGKYFAICNLVIRIKFHFYCHLAFYFVNFCISEETAIKTVIFQFIYVEMN
jgi:hypothetical protein